jgi:hypothetical protein
MEHGFATEITFDQSAQSRHRHHLITNPVGQVHQHGRREPRKTHRGERT